MDVCGVVILYFPDNEIIGRIKTYKDVLKHLVLIDNSAEDNKQLLAPLLTCKNVLYLHDGKNEGIAKRLNQAAELARETGCAWLLTMDQDSFFDKGALQLYFSCTSTYAAIIQVAMFGLEHDERLLSKQEPCAYTKTSHLITSGSLVQLHILFKMRGFDEALFIDHVDHEYCLRSILNGYQIVKIGNILLHHAIGNTSQQRSLKSLKITSRTLHPPLRTYYMLRNFLYIRKRYAPHFKKELRFLRKSLFVHFKNNLLYNKERVQVLKYIIKGYKDYSLEKMGKFK